MAQDPEKVGTARRHLSSIIESEGTNVYSLEMSMLGYKLDRKSDKIHPYTEDHCRDIIIHHYIGCTLLRVQTSSRAAASAGRCTTSTRSADTSRQSPIPRRRSW